VGQAVVIVRTEQKGLTRPCLNSLEVAHLIHTGL
jgi:hypothetical protein